MTEPLQAVLLPGPLLEAGDIIEFPDGITRRATEIYDNPEYGTRVTSETDSEGHLFVVWPGNSCKVLMPWSEYERRTNEAARAAGLPTSEASS